jgi:hypothetical protein
MFAFWEKMFKCAHVSAARIRMRMARRPQETSYQQGVVLARLKKLESARSDRRAFSPSGPGRKNFYRENRQKNEGWKDRTQEVVGQKNSLGYRGLLDIRERDQGSL